MYTTQLLVIFALIGTTFCQIQYTDWQISNYNQIVKIYSNVQYPKNVEIILNSSLLDGLFATNVSGRINPIGNFTDKPGLLEYFYGLTPAVTNNKIGAALGELVVVGFQSMCPEVAAFSGYVPICIYDTVNQKCGATVSYIAQQGFFRFNSQGEVVHYDLVLESFQEVMNILFNVDFTTFLVQEGALEQVCEMQALSCTGLNQIFENSADCEVQLYTKPFGYFWDTWSDTIACRLIHALLAQVDPKTHCPHVSVSGGGKCVSYPYNNKYFLDNTQLFGSQTPFVCPNFPPPTLPTPTPTNATSEPDRKSVV